MTALLDKIFHRPAKRVLILYVNPNSGHHSAALAIQDAFAREHPQVETTVLDFMKFVNPVLAQLMGRAYWSVIRRSPGTWQYLYDNRKVMQATERMRNLTTRLNLNRIRKVITDVKPHVVICTQAIPCGGLAYYKRKKNMPFPLVAVSTDFMAHSYWFHEEVNRYVVPSKREQVRLVSEGINAETIRDFGIPIHPKFSEQRDTMMIKEKHGLDPNMFTFLIMGGSQGLGRIDIVVEQLLKIQADFQLLIVAGTNKSLLKDLNGYQKRGKYERLIKVYSHVDYIEDLMAMANLLITKPGGLTCSEAMTQNCPMILVHPLPGQERQNAEYLVSENVAIGIDSVDELIKLLRSILKDQKILKEIILQQQRLSRPYAAKSIVDMVMQGDLCNT